MATKEITSRYTKEQVSEIATTILRQLGGGKFTVMTGAKNYIAGENEQGAYLGFKIGGGALKGRNYCKITLDAASDTYIMYIAKFRIVNFDPKWSAEVSVSGLYFDQLQAQFTEATGFYTKLF